MTDAPQTTRWRDGAITRGDAILFLATWLALDTLKFAVTLAWRVWHG